MPRNYPDDARHRADQIRRHATNLTTWLATRTADTIDLPPRPDRPRTAKTGISNPVLAWLTATDDQLAQTFHTCIQTLTDLEHMRHALFDIEPSYNLLVSQATYVEQSEDAAGMPIVRERAYGHTHRGHTGPDGLRTPSFPELVAGWCAAIHRTADAMADDIRVRWAAPHDERWDDEELWPALVCLGDVELTLKGTARRVGATGERRAGQMCRCDGCSRHPSGSCDLGKPAGRNVCPACRTARYRARQAGAA